MLFVVDISILAHEMFHVRKVDDLYDVNERVLTKLDRLHTFFDTSQWSSTMWLAVFDNPHATFRHAIFSDYKGQRTSHDDLPEIVESIWEALGNSSDWIRMMAPIPYETDDLIASIAKSCGQQVVIYSTDSDYHACLESGRVTILKKANVNLETRQIEPTYLTENGLVTKYGVPPSWWNNYQAIVGDTSDNLKKSFSWQGAGKTVAKRIYEHVQELSEIDVNDAVLKLNKTQKASYGQFVETLPTHMELLTLKTDVKVPDWAMT